jgi:hydrogenase-4 component F
MGMRRRVRHPASRQAALGGALLAALAAMPLLTWAGLVIATAAALFPARDWDRVPLAGIGLSLALFGIIAASSGPLIAIPPAGILAPTGVVLGYGILAALVPDLIILLPALLLRVLGTLAGGSAQALLLGLGSSALLACAVRLLPRTSERRRLAILPLAQAAAAVVAFGLGGAEAIFAGLVQLILLATSIAAVAVSEGTGPSRLASVAGLAGLPPLGVFPGLVLIVLAVAHQQPWLLVPLGMALMVIGWTTITALPSGRRNGREGISAAWVPLALAVLIGWLLPAGAADWLRDIAVGLAGGLP